MRGRVIHRGLEGQIDNEKTSTRVVWNIYMHCGCKLLLLLALLGHSNSWTNVACSWWGQDREANAKAKSETTIPLL